MEEYWKGVPDPRRVRAGIPISQESDVKNARHACHALRTAVRANEVCFIWRPRVRTPARAVESEDTWEKCQDCGASASVLKGKCLRPTRSSGDDPVQCAGERHMATGDVSNYKWIVDLQYNREAELFLSWRVILKTQHSARSETTVKDICLHVCTNQQLLFLIAGLCEQSDGRRWLFCHFLLSSAF